MREARTWARKSQSDHPVVLTEVEAFPTELVGSSSCVEGTVRGRGLLRSVFFRGVEVNGLGRLPLREGRLLWT